MSGPKDRADGPAQRAARGTTPRLSFEIRHRAVSRNIAKLSG